MRIRDGSADVSPSDHVGFPNPVNEVSARLVATGVVVTAAVTIVLDVRWLTVVLAYGFIARVVAGPPLSPLGQLVPRVIPPPLPVEPHLSSDKRRVGTTWVSPCSYRWSPYLYKKK